jgi:hypothetical protein
MFYDMHLLTIIITCRFIPELEVPENNFGSYTRTRFFEDAHEYYIHEEEIKVFHVGMGNFETKSNGRRDMQEHVTMKILHTEVQNYRHDHERIMKDQKDIIQSLNMLNNKFNKDSDTEK